MSEFMFITALMIWAVAIVVVVAGYYLILKIRDMEKRIDEIEEWQDHMEIIELNREKRELNREKRERLP